MSTSDHILYESPSMCWFRTNKELSAALRSKKNVPAPMDYRRWLRGCQTDPKANRKTYLLFREAIDVEDEEKRAEMKLLISLDKMEPILVEIFGDLF
jgi:hypothetical protein